MLKYRFKFIVPQFFSSEESAQSFSLSHLQYFGMHFLSLSMTHWNSSDLHDGGLPARNQKNIFENIVLLHKFKSIISYSYIFIYMYLRLYLYTIV